MTNKEEIKCLDEVIEKMALVSRDIRIENSENFLYIKIDIVITELLDILYTLETIS